MTYLVFAGLLLGALIIAILIRFGWKVQHNNLWLAACLFCLCYSILLSWMISSGTIRKLPGFTRAGNIAGYLIYTCLFYFVRNTFYPGSLWRKLDWLLLLPAAFYLVDMFPFFLLPAQQKLALFYANFMDGQKRFLQPEGWLVPPSSIIISG